MKRSIMLMLACAAALLGVPAVAVPASASESAPASDDVEWGTAYSLPLRGSQAGPTAQFGPATAVGPGWRPHCGSFRCPFARSPACGSSRM